MGDDMATELGFVKVDLHLENDVFLSTGSDRVVHGFESMGADTDPPGRVELLKVLGKGVHMCDGGSNHNVLEHARVVAHLLPDELSAFDVTGGDSLVTTVLEDPGVFISKDFKGKEPLL